MDADPLTALGLSPQAFHFLKRRGVDTVAQLCAKCPQEFIWAEPWLTPFERWDRLLVAGRVLLEVRERLANRALSLRGDRYALLRNEPVEKLQLSPRAMNVLRRLSPRTVGDLVALTTDEIFCTSSFGQTSLGELLRGLARHGLHLADGRPYGPEDLNW